MQLNWSAFQNCMRSLSTPGVTTEHKALSMLWPLPGVALPISQALVLRKNLSVMGDRNGRSSSGPEQGLEELEHMNCTWKDQALLGVRTKHDPRLSKTSILLPGSHLTLYGTTMAQNEGCPWPAGATATNMTQAQWHDHEVCLSLGRWLLSC